MHPPSQAPRPQESLLRNAANAPGKRDPGGTEWSRSVATHACTFLLQFNMASQVLSSSDSSAIATAIAVSPRLCIVGVPASHQYHHRYSHRVAPDYARPGLIPRAAVLTT